MSYDDDFPIYDLEHHGVKGMKWGVRKQRLSDRKIDKKFIKNVVSTSSRIAIYNNAANEQNNGGIERFNAKWKGKNLKDPQVNREYHMAYEKEFQKVLEKHAKQAGVTSPTGNFSIIYSYKNGGFIPDAIVIKNNPDVKDIKHSDTGDEVTYKIQRDLEGRIQSLTKQDILEHFGVKGMKWGVRKAGKSYMDASRKHEVKTKARRERQNAKLKAHKERERAHAKKVANNAVQKVGKVKKAIKDYLDKTAPTTYTDSDGNTWTVSSKMTRAKENELRAQYEKTAKGKQAIEVTLAQIGNQTLMKPKIVDKE